MIGRKNNNNNVDKSDDSATEVIIALIEDCFNTVMGKLVSSLPFQLDDISPEDAPRTNPITGLSRF